MSANENAFPLHKPRNTDIPAFTAYGLTKRELFAAMAMQGLFSNPDDRGHVAEYARFAVKAADALLAELAKEQS